MQEALRFGFDGHTTGAHVAYQNTNAEEGGINMGSPEKVMKNEMHLRLFCGDFRGLRAKKLVRKT